MIQCIQYKIFTCETTCAGILAIRRRNVYVYSNLTLFYQKLRYRSRKLKHIEKNRPHKKVEINMYIKKKVPIQHVTGNTRKRCRRLRYKSAVHVPDFDTPVPAPGLSLAEAKTIIPLEI